MASSKEYLEFILGQLSELEEITYRAMMGEFIIYYCGKMVGGIDVYKRQIRDSTLFPAFDFLLSAYETDVSLHLDTILPPVPALYAVPWGH